MHVSTLLYVKVLDRLDKINTVMKKALITGITGQDGSYLAEFLLDKGYEVHGIVRPVSSFNTDRVNHIFERVQLHYGDMCDSHSLNTVVRDVEPDEIYNLAAQSHVWRSFRIPDLTTMTDALGVLRLLEAVRFCKLDKTCRIYQASTSEMYGNSKTVPQNESTPFMPASPYACAKLYAHHIVRNYRESYGMFICSGILFNHESPRRDYRFVTRKVTKAVADYATRRESYKPIHLGDLNSQRDWGFAGDYVEGMWRMLQQDMPKDYVLATGVTRSVRCLVETAFALRNVTVKWTGDGLLEQCIDSHTGNVLVIVDSEKMRPTEVNLLKGDASLAMKELGWKPKVLFEDMIEMMIAVDE